MSRCRLCHWSRAERLEIAALLALAGLTAWNIHTLIGA